MKKKYRKREEGIFSSFVPNDLHNFLYNFIFLLRKRRDECEEEGKKVKRNCEEGKKSEEKTYNIVRFMQCLSAFLMLQLPHIYCFFKTHQHFPPVSSFLLPFLLSPPFPLSSFLLFSLFSPSSLSFYLLNYVARACFKSLFYGIR